MYITFKIYICWKTSLYSIWLKQKIFWIVIILFETQRLYYVSFINCLLLIMYKMINILNVIIMKTHKSSVLITLSNSHLIWESIKMWMMALIGVFTYR